MAEYITSIAMATGEIAGTPRTITGCPFEPVSVEFFAVGRTAATQSGTNWRQVIGAATSSSAQWCMSWHAVDTHSTNFTRIRSRMSNSLCAVVIDAGEDAGAIAASVMGSISFTAFTADGCTLAVGTQATSNWLFVVRFTGGSGVTAQAGTRSIPAGTGNFNTITTINPTCGRFVLGIDQMTAFNSFSGEAGYAYGCIDSAKNQGCVGSRYRDGQTSTTAGDWSWISTAHALAIVAGTTAYSTTIDAAATTWSAGSFTLNKTLGTAANVMGYLVFGGLDSKVGTFATRNTGAPDDEYAVAGLSFQPDGMTAMGRPQATATMTVAAAPDELCFGFASAAANQVALWGGAPDVGTLSGSVKTWSESRHDTSRFLINYDKHATVHGTPGAIGEVEFVGFNVDGFTLRQKDVDAQASLMLYMATRTGSAGGSLIYDRRRRAAAALYHLGLMPRVGGAG